MTKRAVIDPPADKIPSRTVPKADECEYDKDVSDIRLTAAHPDIHVIAQPIRQCDVPTLPEFTWVPGEVGLTEINRQFNAKQAAETNRHH